MDDEPGLMKSVASLEQLIAQEVKNAQIPEESIVIGGFSQGSVISLLTGITTTKKLGGVVALSGWVPLNHKIAEVSSHAGPPLKDVWLIDDEIVADRFPSRKGSRRLLGTRYR